VAGAGLTLLLRNCTVYDGTGSPPFRAQVGVAGERIAWVGPGNAGEAERVLDLDGLALTPGFIDVHSHSDFTLLADPRGEGKVLQGVTTEINGNCGLSGGPLLGEARAQREGDLEEYGITQRWEALAEYLDLLEKAAPALNVATLVGQGNIRASVMGFVRREPRPAEMEAMKALLAQCLREGALGLSTGLIYPPGAFTGTGELIALSAAGAEFPGFLYATHMRSEGERLLEAIEETLAIGRGAGVPVHVSHLKASGHENWSKAARAASLLADSIAAGGRVTADRYPYTAGSTDLDAVLPSWCYEGGNAEELRRLRDPSLREKIKAGMPAGNWDQVVISSVETGKNRWMQGRSIEEVARTHGLEPRECVLTLLLEESLRVGAIFHSMSEENLRMFLSLPFVMVGTDGSARSRGGPTEKGRPHPRGFGSFPRYLSFGAPGLPEAIRRITLLPARTFGLAGRGAVREGTFADLVAFDPERLRDRATFEEPFLPPEGMAYVVVNGVVAAEEGRLTGARAGRVLRRSAAR
jgi:N-acyl-D-amino-acid deacylase